MITPLNFKYDYNIEYRLSNIKYNFTSVFNLSISYEQQTHIDFRNRTTRGVPETAAIRCRFVVSEGGARKENDIERNQIKVVLATGIFEGTRDGVRNAARLKRRNKKANKKEKRLRKERKRERERNVETTGWLAVLADQISRMAPGPLNRSYFYSCSQRSRLTRRKTFYEYLHRLQER